MTGHKCSKLIFSIVLLLLVVTFAQNQSGQSVDDMKCPDTFWTEIEQGCNSNNTTPGSRFRVIEGKETDVARWPYLVSLQRRLTGPFRGCYLHRCGATLIAPDLVLTAAHCLWSPNHDYRHTSIPNVLGVELYAALGPKCRHQSGKGRVKVARYFISDDYIAESETRGGGDIAILQLDRPLDGGMVVNIGKSKNVSLDDKQLTIVGWGDTEADDVSYAIRALRMGNLKHVVASICEAIMSAVSDGRLAIQSDKEICAYNSEVDSCDGDSGGPLLLANQKDDPSKDIQVGIVSWGPPGACGQSRRQLVGVYTSVSYYLPWIEQIKKEVKVLPPIEPTQPDQEMVSQPPQQQQPKCKTTKNGCQCPAEWTFNSPTIHSGCQNPDGDPKGPWCIIVPDSCPRGIKPEGTLVLNDNPTGSQYDYCEAKCAPKGSDDTKDEACQVTVAGCQCKSSWEIGENGGEIFTGCANPDDDPRGTWCHYENPTCIDKPAGTGWDYCKPGCGLAQLKQTSNGLLVKELNDEWHRKKACSCNENPSELSEGISCKDVVKLGKCSEDDFGKACPCSCQTCFAKELSQGG
eukprot:TRINITY_DN11275_c0_g1_i3.p1 TRINITY_DN11275_c0_g1~~TRINITY_DN11275_c0_g1_i3.p1  ORF type:complete len:575 (-),score=88.94 TRINITY_DN11275_c0_g1_i3:1384-3108(-)